MKRLRTFLSVALVFTPVIFASLSFAATVTGTITYNGEIPKLPSIKMDADPICLTHHSGTVLPQVLVLGNEETKTMAYVFVHVTKGLPQTEHPTPTEAAVLDQKGCMYEPHVLGVMVNQPVKILNPDGTLHNVHAMPKVNEEFNLAMPKFRTEVSKAFDKAEFMFPIKCDVHPWMGAYITVMEHPYFNVTGLDGKYTIDNLPAGKYDLEAWHEKLGTQTATVELAEGETKEINFTFSKSSE